MTSNYEKAIQLVKIIAKMEHDRPPAAGYLEEVIIFARQAYDELNGTPMSLTESNAFEELTQLQRNYGYGPGEINPIALFGLFGEAGEVLAEVVMSDKGPDDYNSDLLHAAVTTAQMVDRQKKRIRKNPETAPDIFIIQEDGGAALDLEIADTLYYLNLLALNRGKTLAEYAALSVAKVKEKKMKQQPGDV